jgi:hypothetical protein
LFNTICRRLALSPRELLALLAAFALSLPAVTPRIYASDEIQYFSYLRSLWFDRDVSFENEYQHFFDLNIGRGEGFHATFLEQVTEAGRRPSYATLGCALLWAPFYAAADVITRASGGVADGFSRPYISAVAYGSAVYGFLAVLLSIAAARRISGPGLIAGIVVWLATPLLFYMYVSPPYSHACSAFAVALLVTIWLDVRTTWSLRGAVALGLSAALMTMVREQDAFLALGPAVDFIWSLAANDGSTRDVRARSAMVRTAAGGIVAFALGVLPQLLAYKALNGHFGPSTQVARKMNWQSPHALDVIASPEHGFFFWTPAAVLAIAGLVVLALRGSEHARRIGWCALVMVTLQIYVSGSVESWTVAGAFGQRRFVALTILLTIGIAALIAATPRGSWRPAVGIVLGLCVWWNVALMAEFGTGLMNRQRLEPRRNAYDAFITLPRLVPELAYRYFTNRESFYQRPPTADER